MPWSLGKLGSLFRQSEERPTWSGRLDFLMAAVSYTMPLGVLWRFPYLVYRNGGAIFFVPIFFFMGVLGLPMVFFETSLGQLCSSGPLTCWKFQPFMQGMGLAMVFTSAIVAIYQSSILGMTFYYLFSSFTSELPWSRCTNEWNTDACVDTDSGKSNCTNFGSYEPWTRWCTDPTDEYFHRAVLQLEDQSDLLSLDTIGHVVWYLALCNLFTWVIVAVVLSRTVTFYGKVSYVTTICPLVLLLVLFIFGLTLDGHPVGYKYFTFANLEKISDVRVWGDAASQVFYSLSVSFGGLITLGSYNRFHNDTYRDSLIICTMNIVSSLLSGFTVFFFYGALAYLENQPVDQVVSSSFGMTFMAMPRLWSATSAPQLWSICWFLMLACMSLGTQLGLVETVITGLLDLFPRLRRYRLVVVIAVCCSMFLLALPYTTQASIAMLSWIDGISCAWNVKLLPVLELIALLMYGVPRFLNDVEVMTGSRILGIFPVILGKLWMGFYLFFPTLFTAVCMFITHIVISLEWTDPRLPDWARTLGKLLQACNPVFIAAGAVLAIVLSVKRNLRATQKDWFDFVMPTKDWGPALVEHRMLFRRMVPWFVVDPWNRKPDNEETTAINLEQQ